MDEQTRLGCGCGSRSFVPFAHNKFSQSRYQCIHCHQVYESDGQNIYLVNLMDLWHQSVNMLKRSERNMVTATREDQLKKVNRMKSLYADQDYYYVLQDIHEIDPTPYLVKTKIDPDAMELLIAYIQAKGDEIQHGYTVVKVEMVELLVKHFGAELSNQHDADWRIIEFYFNWEKWCGKFAEINRIKHFQNAALVADLKALAEKAGHP